MWHAMFSLKTITLALVLLLSSIQQIISTSYCPSHCVCDDINLLVKCNEGQLDVLPIALNPSIKRLTIQYNKIKFIDYSIQFYTELEILDLSYNHLLNIPKDSFAYQKKLLQLHLNNNKIGVITNKTFVGLNELQVLNLKGNYLETVDAKAFAQLTSLQELNLGGNRISTLNEQAFLGLTSLQVLYLDDNSLTRVPTSATFDAIKNLAELFLGLNSLGRIENGAFEMLRKLNRLDIHATALSNLSIKALQGLSELKVLDVSDNQFTKIPTVQLSKLKRLEELNIGQNMFESVPEGAFYGLTNLKRLSIIGSTVVRRIQSGAFSINTNLETLVIASNRNLDEIEEGAFSGLPYLKNAILRNNALKTLREDLLPWKHLEYFDVSENPMKCDCQLHWLVALLKTDKSMINFSKNSVTCATPERFHGEPLLTLSSDLIGCVHISSKERAKISVILVVTAALLTTLGLITFKLRHRLRFMLDNTHTKSPLRHYDNEYQKTYPEDDSFVATLPQRNQNIYEYVYKIHPTLQNNSHYSQLMHNQQNFFKPIPVSEL